MRNGPTGAFGEPTDYEACAAGFDAHGRAYSRAADGDTRIRPIRTGLAPSSA
ncbi:hypothetical protein [Streptosporangium lutulentum]|uniref:Uncharacterized protein n=1 Tax=Streptosporangium lutulentum TaxID=1461250 RepID=A0ABT9Q361_9ACTN|nr:hypothetical protein [Streptosporangium lutulentum]MDP9841186.1 hypothetical protein [Streptosporangium lutulentum]